MSDIRLIILMRNDLESLVGTATNRRIGKACAQATHAANQMMATGSSIFNAIKDEWSNQAEGFGTCIVLSVDEAQMRETVRLAKLSMLHSGITHDPSYPVRDGSITHFVPLDTCAFIFGEKADLDLLLSEFSLLP